MTHFSRFNPSKTTLKRKSVGLCKRCHHQVLTGIRARWVDILQCLKTQRSMCHHVSSFRGCRRVNLYISSFTSQQPWCWIKKYIRIHIGYPWWNWCPERNEQHSKLSKCWLIAFKLLPNQRNWPTRNWKWSGYGQESIGAEMWPHCLSGLIACQTYDQKLSTTCPSKSDLPRNSITLRRISSSVPVVSKGISISTQPWEDKDKLQFLLWSPCTPQFLQTLGCMESRLFDIQFLQGGK